MAAAVGVVVVTLAGPVAYLTLTDLGRHREWAEDRLSASLGLEVRIRELHVDLDLTGPSRFEARPLAPRRGGVKILRYDLVWIY